MTYTVIDVETTGRGNRITEISIFKVKGGKVIDEFTSLVNPESDIPMNITVLTGIDNNMVADAPIWKEIGQKVLDITEGTVFVAHSVNFDYNVIRGEFKRIDVNFNRKKLCTVRLSRRLLPGHRSYSLGKLCRDLEINITDRHRARGDAEATVILFNILNAQEKWPEVIKEFFQKSSKEATLPPNLPSEVFNAIPHEAGIYFFKDKKGKIIYVGKAKDLKKRVLGHFYNKTKKELDLCRETRDISFELSGSELIALLMEDHAIKHHYPRYNQVAKTTIKGFAILKYIDQKGIIHLAVDKIKNARNPLAIFYSANAARVYMEQLCNDYELCPKYCHLQENVNFCTHYFIQTCKGICKSEESEDLYNERVNDAINEMVMDSESFIIKVGGRTFSEQGFVMVKDGKYLGYGFLDKDSTINHVGELEDYLTLQKDNAHVQRIIRSHILSKQEYHPIESNTVWS
ncbi:MAG: DNA polymerase-3 subunit epsilon [Patiriisocius sp.]|jgi:DNA polymerase-3 subunit epsilon